jgi:cell division protein FtsL
MNIVIDTVKLNKFLNVICIFLLLIVICLSIYSIKLDIKMFNFNTNVEKEIVNIHTRMNNIYEYIREVNDKHIKIICDRVEKIIK